MEFFKQAFFSLAAWVLRARRAAPKEDAAKLDIDELFNEPVPSLQEDDAARARMAKLITQYSEQITKKRNQTVSRTDDKKRNQGQ